jgi:hypothetical protein
MTVAALIFVPFVAWHAWRAIRAFKTGIFESFDKVLSRAAEPNLFWSRVAREFLLAALFAALLLSLLFGLGWSPLAWLFGGYAAVYVTIIFTTIMRRRRRPDHAA